MKRLRSVLAPHPSTEELERQAAEELRAASGGPGPDQVAPGPVAPAEAAAEPADTAGEAWTEEADSVGPEGTATAEEAPQEAEEAEVEAEEAEVEPRADLSAPPPRARVRKNPPATAASRRSAGGKVRAASHRS